MIIPRTAASPGCTSSIKIITKRPSGTLFWLVGAKLEKSGPGRGEILPSTAQQSLLLGG